MVQNRWTGRAIFYASRLNGAIYNRTLSSTAALIQRVRSNGDARAMGTELELEWRAAGALTVTSAWAINNSTFTSGPLLKTPHELPDRTLPIELSRGPQVLTPPEVRWFGPSRT
jgi:hypothetical protein